MSDYNELFIKSRQIEHYNNAITRQSFDNLYLSEKVTLERILPAVRTVTDIGCQSGDIFGVIRSKYKIDYTGIDIDSKAIDIANKKYPEAKFFVSNFLDEDHSIPKSDLVVAFNVFDHFKDWKKALRGLKRYSKKYINFSTLLRIDGPTVVDYDISYAYYMGQNKRILYAAHNIYELASYCGTEDIQAKSIYVYAYHKYTHEKGNMDIAGVVSVPFPIENLLVGNVVIEWDSKNNMSQTTIRPDLTIVIDDQIICESPWKKG